MIAWRPVLLRLRLSIIRFKLYGLFKILHDDMDFNDLAAFASVVRAGGFREAARASGVSASSLSTAVRRLEAKLDLRLLHRTTRSVAPTEAGRRLLERITPLFGEMEAALDVLNVFRDKPTGTLRLNVSASAAWVILPDIVASFMKAYPGIRVEVLVEDGFVDLLSMGCDAGIRYDERLEQDMIATPIGPRTQQFATAAAASYPGPVHANSRLALATRRAERKECDEANTRRIREEHDAAIGPSGGQPHKAFFDQGNVPYRAHCVVVPRCNSYGYCASSLLALRPVRHVRKPGISVNRP